MGASDPNGCLVRYVGSDVILSGNATDTTPNTWCTAGNRRRILPRRPVVVAADVEDPGAARQQLAGNTTTCSGRGSTSGRSIRTPWTIPMAFWKSLYPDTTTQAAPGITWDVWHEGTVRLSAGRFQRRAGQHVVQRQCGCARDPHRPASDPGLEPAIRANTARSPPMPAPRSPQRSYNDVLPAVNFALNMTDKLTMRLAYLQEHDAAQPEPVGRRPAARTTRCRKPRTVRYSRLRRAPRRAIRTSTRGAPRTTVLRSSTTSIPRA